MTEITERAMTVRPAELLSTAGGIRDAGWGIALDDVGAEPASLALMPFLDPDVVKLDLRLIQDTPTEDLAEVINAVNAEAERSNLTILSEGIETPQHERTSLAFGATLGQGWLYGKPGPLPDPIPEATRQVQLLGRKLGARQARVSKIVGTMQSVRSGTKPILHSMSRHLETQARSLGETCVVLAMFEDAQFFAGATKARYEELAQINSFVGVIGPGMPPEPAPGVRSANIDGNDELFDQWGVAIISPHFAAAFVGRPRGDRNVPDNQREYDFALTYNREFVVETARNLAFPLAQITWPVVPGGTNSSGNPTAVAKAGKLEVARSSAQVAAKGPTHITLRLSRAALKRLRKLHHLRVVAMLTFTPTGGSPAARQKAITLRAS
jgi:hypothetical protein